MKLSHNLLLTTGVVALLSLTGVLNGSYHHNEYHPLSLMRGDIEPQTRLLHLQEEYDIDSLFEKEDFTESYFRYPFESFDVFRREVHSFLTAKERKSSLIYYQVVDDKLAGRFQVSLGGGIDYHTSFDDHYLHPYRRVSLKGNINNRLLFWGDWWAGRFQGDLDYAELTSPLLKGWFKSHELDGQSYTNLNRVAGQISYLFSFGNVSIGRGVHQTEDSISGSIILNNETNDYGYFSTEILFGKLKLSFLHASLIPNAFNPIYTNPYPGVRHFVDKYLAQHQISYQPHPNLNLYFGEQVVYANRGIDINYLLPHTFYRITEHNLHDRDNMLIYAGGRWKVMDSVTLYGSLSLDELRKSEILGDWWGNKYALQGGISKEYLPGLISSENREISTTLELTAVRPWMYTHKSYHTNFSHDGSGLGFPGGSNLIQGAAEIDFPLMPYLDFNFLSSYAKQGSFGNCWCRDYDSDYRKDAEGNYIDTAKWLDGDVSRSFRSRGVFTLSILAHHSLKMGMEWIKQTGIDWQKELVLSYSFIY